VPVLALVDREPSLLDALCRRVRIDVHRAESVGARAAAPRARAALAQEVIALREAGAFDEYLAAAALVDLGTPSSALARSCAAAVVRRARFAGRLAPAPALQTDAAAV
jgi:hypothetical protein